MDEKELEKAQKFYEAQNQMMANTIKDIKRRKGNNLDEKTMKKIDEASEDILMAAEMNTGLRLEKAEVIADKEMENEKTVTVKNTEVRSMQDRIEEYNKKKKRKKTEPKKDTAVGDDELMKWAMADNDAPRPSKEVYETPMQGDTPIPFDIIQLPSNGECYASKTRSAQVSYLTAYDENLLTSPNLYRDGLVIELLLENKVKVDGVEPDELVRGDVDAIMLYLRAQSYGNEYPVTVQDPATKVKFDSVVDLSKLKYKEFKLKGDENGLFEYVLPKSGDTIKFRYTTRKDERDMEMISKIDTNGSRSVTIRQEIAMLTTLLQDDNVLSSTEKQNYYALIGKIGDWAKQLEENSDGNQYNRYITNRLEMCIVSVNGNSNREFIHNYVMRMPAGDSLSFRRYLFSNEPGVDWTVTIERPENLGGGSFETFLEWDDDVFLHFAGI